MSNTTTDDQALRIAIAEKLGWTSGKFYCEENDETYLWKTSGDEFHNWPPNFTVDANAALLLVEHMRKEGFRFRIQSTDTGEFEMWFFCGLRGTDSWRPYYATAPTFPLAVAKAFAMANGINPQP